MHDMELVGIVLDVDYLTRGSRGIIRLTLKTNDGAYQLFDPGFYPYFYLVPNNDRLDEESLLGIRVDIEGIKVGANRVEERRMLLEGKEVRAFKLYFDNPRNVPRFSGVFSEFGTCYENDIVFWKRYLIDKQISPLSLTKARVHKEGEELVIDEVSSAVGSSGIEPTCVCFDIETYNPFGNPREDKDPIIMISYTDGREHGVITYKKIDKGFVKMVANEKEMIKWFVDVIKRLNPDIIVGYNSSNFDIPYLMKRAQKLRIDFQIGRYGEEAKKEHHGLIEAVRIPGRINLDLYNVAKFVSVVGASEKIIKVNSFKLYEVYRAITGKEKKMVEKLKIWEVWDRGGEDLERLAEYSLDDSLTLKELYDFFLPLEMEVARVSGTTLGEASISTTSQLVDFVLMRYSYLYNQIIPNKPNEGEISERAVNPYEGAYVKTPDAGIYDNIVVFDFRGLYPSIIIAHNIDPATVCDDCKEFYESPDGVKFRKDRVGIVPLVLKMLVDERAEAKKAYKKNPDNKALAAKSTALKILANAFYGYLGYPRARWYSRACASSVTAYGRFFITQTIEGAERFGFRVLYADTDGIFLLRRDKTKEDVNQFLKNVNGSLPSTMELELEDYYVRGVFVGKRGGEVGAKKKYALLSESGRIKIRGFELVRRDWSKIARDTQLAVLEAILKEGSKEKAVRIVQDTINRLKEGRMDIKDLVINTQLRKGLKNYDVQSPELAAAKKAIEKGAKRRDEIEGVAIGYVITKHGSSISEKAEVEELAEDYDPNYYIDHQIIPATLKILKELGYNADELKNKGAQKKL